MSRTMERYAGVRQRIACGAIDLCLLLLVLGIATWIGLALQGPAPATGEELVDGMSSLWSGNFLLGAASVALIALAFFWTLLSATPGQLLMGCRVVSAGSNRRLNVVLALWRGILLLALGGVVGVPLITMFFDRRRRGIHDLLSASTVNLEDESKVGLKEWEGTIA